MVRLNSFSQAAEENYISQSAISQQIQALEKELGFPLLERKNRRFTLTAAGAYFYQKSLSFTAEYEKMCAEAAQAAGRSCGVDHRLSALLFRQTNFTGRWRNLPPAVRR